VDQVEVDVVEAQALEALLQRAPGLVVAMGVVEALRGHEDLVAGQAGGPDRLADALLVAVGRRRVDVAVAGPERAAGDGGGVLGRHLEDAEAELGDVDGAAQRDARNLLGHSGHPPALTGAPRTQTGAGRRQNAAPRGHYATRAQLGSRA
jgi:hypothetical protein